MERRRNPAEPTAGETSQGYSPTNPGKDRLPPETLLPLYLRHRRGALIRSGGAFFMWLFALIGFLIGDSQENHFWGISGAVIFLILINFPTLFILKKASSPTGIKSISLLTNFLEAAGYTVVMYFLGGIEATYLTPIYGILIFYVGIVAPRRYPFYVASFCALFFSLMVLTQLGGWLPTQNVNPHFHMPLKRQLVSLSVVLGLLFLTAFAAAHTSGILRKQRNRIQRQKRGLEIEVAARTAELQEKNLALEQELLRRREAERNLRVSEENYRRIFESSFDVIYTLDTQAKILSISPSVKQALGYEPEELVGKSIVDLNVIAPECLEEAFKNALRIFAGESIRAVEYQFIDRQGGPKYAEISGAPLIQEGKVAGLISIARDITERKQAEAEKAHSWEEMERRVQERTRDLARARQEAEAANRAKSEFLANMSHELRTPLNAIIGFSEFLLDRHLGELNRDQAEYIGDIAASGQHLLSLINDILDLAKVESGKMDLALEPVSLPALLQRGAALIKEKAAKHRIRFSCTSAGTPDTFLADERKMKQIIFNLLGNAVKFTPDGGAVSIDVRVLSRAEAQTAGNGALKSLLDNGGPPVESLLHFRVADTGIGIGSADLERIFYPFEQADNSISRSYQGTGLGLALTRTLAEMQGGLVWAESEGLGKGSTFHFLVPLRTARPMSPDRGLLGGTSPEESTGYGGIPQ